MSKSTLTEVLLRGKIIEISKATIRENTYICIFHDGTQCNIDEETLKQLNYEQETISNS
jgi:hypothetical protein